MAAINVQRLSYQIEQAGFSLPDYVVKRDGSLRPFDVKRIYTAVERCFDDLDTPPKISPAEVAEGVTQAIIAHGDGYPSVEAIQDAVEFYLLSHGEFDAAKHYILYRERRAAERKVREIPTDVALAFEASAEYFPTQAQQFTFFDKYSRYDWDKGRRETWLETVDRVVDHLRWEVEQHKPGAIPEADFERIRSAILSMDVMPSMRLLAQAGPAAQRNSLSIYNCSAMPVCDIQSFVEALLISMAGCGVGYSVERQFVEQLPRIRRQGGESFEHVIEDTTEGWGEAIRVGLTAWWNGQDVTFDASLVRPAGAPLRTKGGRASGPAPLLNSLAVLRDVVLSRQGSYLRPVDAHLMMCAIGDAAVQGGVRRTAMIALFDWDDHEMRNVKAGPNMNPLLHNANNSAVWPEDISDLDIMQQMLDMAKSRSGEPGIFSRANANATKPERRKAATFLTNPCGEIFLRPWGLCNLTQAVCRPGDSEEDLRTKVELATIIGVIQSLSTRFPGMREEWKINAEEERLLGVDLTAQADCELTRKGAEDGAGLRERLRARVLEVAEHYAGLLEINMPAATTCNKPAGNSTELLGASGNGIHDPHSPYFIRRMTVGAHTPLFQVLRAAGVPMEPLAGSSAEDAVSWKAEFPKKAPEGARTKGEVSAVEQLEFWLLNKTHWTEHNPSCTISYREDEIIDVIAWVLRHKDKIGGLSFLPADGTVYAQMPFEEISEEEYIKRSMAFPEVDYSKLYRYELEDMTTAAQELACFAGSCEI